MFPCYCLYVSVTMHMLNHVMQLIDVVNSHEELKFPNHLYKTFSVVLLTYWPIALTFPEGAVIRH